MEMALAQWDKDINAVEDRVKSGLRNAPDLRVSQLHVELGIAYRMRGRLDDAIREFDASIRLRPSGSDVRVLRALTLEAAGRPADAAQSFQDAWTLDPSNAVKAYYVASRPSIDRAVRDKARAFLASAVSSVVASAFRRADAPPFVVLDAIPDNLSQAPVVGDETTGEVFGLLADRHYKEAIAALTHPKRTDSPRLHLTRGQTAEAENRVSDGRREYQLALRGALAGRSVILVAIGRLAQVDGDLAGAIDALTRATRLNPNDSFLRYELSAALAADGRSDEAMIELFAALVINPKDAQAYAAIGQLHLGDERYRESINAFNRALELAPERYEVRYSLAMAYERMGDGTKAAQEREIYDRARRAAFEQRRRDLATQ